MRSNKGKKQVRARSAARVRRSAKRGAPLQTWHLITYAYHSLDDVSERGFQSSNKPKWRFWRLKLIRMFVKFTCMKEK